MSFGNYLVVSYYFGTSAVLDSYLALLASANFLLFFVQPLREALVPPVFSAVAADREHASKLFTAGLALQVSFALVAMAVLISVKFNAVEILVGKTTTYSPELLFWFLPFFVLFPLAETCNGLLLSFNRAVFQAMARLLSATMGLGCIWLLADHIGVLALLLSLVIAQICNLTISSIGLWKEGIRLVWGGVLALRHEQRFKSVFSSLLLSYLFVQVYMVTERFTMLGMFPGLVASYQYSVALVNVLVSLLAFPLTNLLWPRFLADAVKDGTDAMLNTAFGVVAPLVLALFACCTLTERFAPEIVKLLFERGSFDASSVVQTTQALRSTIFAAIPVSLLTIFSKILFSQGRGRAIGLSGTSVALSGTTVVLLAGWTGSVTLVQWNWVIGNTIGLFVMLYLILRRATASRHFLLTGWTLIWRSSLAALLAIVITPDLTSVNTLSDIFFGLFFSCSVFSVFFVGILYLMGILYLPNKRYGFFS